MVKEDTNKLRIKEWWPVLKSKLTGHYNYFGVSGNYRCLQEFYNKIFFIVFKWINRRSQKKSMNFDQYQNYLQWNPLPTPRIYHAMY